LNATQRKSLDALNVKLQTTRDAIEELMVEFRSKFDDLAGDLEIIATEIESERDDEQDKFDNMPEGLQAGERGQAIEQAISTLESTLETIESARQELTSDYPDIEAAMTSIGEASDELNNIE
jgi:predicted  nucleic acid-binding Zn-ribbon protein